MARAMQITAALQGVASLIAKIAPKDSACKPCGGADGRPGAMYKGGGWFFGVYFGGAKSEQGGPGNLNIGLTVGVDITRVLGKIPPSELGSWWQLPDELFEQVSRVQELLSETDPAWSVAEACNVALNVLCGGNRNGTFYEHFDTSTVSSVKSEPAEWIVGVSQQNSPVYVVRTSFSGLKFLKLAEEMQK